ncbi:hypothetical protein C0992_009183 [Termitomyces sp. T32_za158]|nr:hypothetical protein C0992_009183 [Termitomyces sp. T32_za158]
MAKPIIAVVTGTGAQGRAVSRAFHNSGLWQVRILTRNPDGKVATSFRDEGMDVVQANFEDKTSLLRAFKGAYAVFSVTIPPWHKSYMHTMGEYDQGVLQADAAKESNVQLFLFSTLPYVGPEFMGLGGVELYDAKARTNDYIMSIGLPGVFIGTEIERQTGLETRHTVIPDADGRWHRDLTKAFIYQNNHGLYPEVVFPTQATLDLGVKFGTLEEFVRMKIVPMFAE